MQLTEQKEIDTVWQNDNEPMTSFTAPGVSATDGTSFAGKVGELYAPSRDQEKAKEYLATALSELGCTVDELSGSPLHRLRRLRNVYCRSFLLSGAVETGSRHRGYR